MHEQTPHENNSHNDECYEANRRRELKTDYEIERDKN